jgi:hypothetical protein
MAGGESLHKIADDPDMPARSTILRWISKNEIFARQYTAAREALQDYWWDMAMAVAFDGSGDIIIENGKTKVDTENVHRSRLKVDTIKWTLSKLNPRKFGDTPDLSSGDDIKPPITVIRRTIAYPLMAHGGSVLNLEPGTPEYKAALEREHEMAEAQGRPGYEAADKSDHYARARLRSF